MKSLIIVLCIALWIWVLYKFHIMSINACKELYSKHYKYGKKRRF